MLTFVGAATLDALALVEDYPAADQRVVARELTWAGGGPAATAAVVAARQGHRVAFAGAVGEDEEGERIVAGLRAEGVDTSGVVTVPGARSGASVVVVAARTATRAISNRPLPLADLAATPTVLELLAASTWVHVDHIGWAPTTNALPHLPRRPLLSFDGGHQVPGFTAAGLDLYVPTVEALVIRLGERPVRDLLRTAGAECGGTVVATAGSTGCWGLEPGGEPVHAPAADVPVLSTLGAGDVFHGALVAAVAEGRPLAEAMGRANAVAALSCRGLDGRSAVPSAAELDAFLTDDPTPRTETARSLR